MASSSFSAEEELKNISSKELEEKLKPITSWRCKNNSSSKFKNWSGDFEADPLAIFKPNNEDEIKLILELCRREKKSIRCFGAGHSPSDLACSQDYMINLDEMSGLIQVDRDSKCIQVWAGTRLKDFNRIAHQHNLALSVLGSIAEQSVGGAISTATHGCGYNYGSISSYVKSLTIILANTRQITVDNDEGEDIFLASLCGLGLTGIITRVKFQCETSFNLEEFCFSIPFNSFLYHYDFIAKSAQHVRMYWFPQVNRVRVEQLNRTMKPCDPDTWTKTVGDKLMWFFQWYIHPSILLVTKYFPALTDYYMMAHYHLLSKPLISIPEVKEKDKIQDIIRQERMKSNNKMRVNSSVKVFNFDCGPPHHTYEGAIPFEFTSDALNDFRCFLKSQSRLKMHFPMEIRPVDADQIWISPSFNRKVTYLGLVQFKAFGMEVNKDYQDLFDKFEQVLETKYTLRSHWAKKHSQDVHSLRKSFDCSTSLQNSFDKFLSLRQVVDPDFRFSNEYIMRCFADEE